MPSFAGAVCAAMLRGMDTLARTDGYKVEFVGSEREPVVTIDDFSGQVAGLVEMGRAASYQPARGYPGIRSPMNPAYLGTRSELLREIFARCFGLPGKAELE